MPPGQIILFSCQTRFPDFPASLFSNRSTCHEFEYPTLPPAECPDIVRFQFLLLTLLLLLLIHFFSLFTHHLHNSVPPMHRLPLHPMHRFPLHPLRFHTAHLLVIIKMEVVFCFHSIQAHLKSLPHSTSALLILPSLPIILNWQMLRWSLLLKIQSALKVRRNRNLTSFHLLILILFNYLGCVTLNEGTLRVTINNKTLLNVAYEIMTFRDCGETGEFSRIELVDSTNEASSGSKKRATKQYCSDPEYSSTSVKVTVLDCTPSTVANSAVVPLVFNLALFAVALCLALVF